MSFKKIFSLSILTLSLLSFKLQAQFIDEVLEYVPAPGQYINESPWGMPESTNSIIGTVNGSLCLGAFGGYVVFKFENPVQNHPDNPFGVDFTIFGNPQFDWSEPGIVYVMKDENENGLPDDTWYELAGSDYFFSSTKKDYQVTYFNPNSPGAANVPWTDNYGYSNSILTNGINLEPYYPLKNLFPHISDESYTLSGTVIDGRIDTTNPAMLKSYKRAFGYADNQYRGSAPYTLPDNPYTNERENAGGDAFDIDWAIDENGNYVDLDCIHFIKVQTGMAKNVGRLGEISTEITGAVVVEPNNSIVGNLDLIVIKDLPDTIIDNKFPLEAYYFHKGRLQTDNEIVWESSEDEINIVDDKLVFGICGILPVTFTASLKDNPEISQKVFTVIKSECGGINNNGKHVKIYPNPAQNFIKIDVEEQSKIIIYDSYGRTILNKENYSVNQSIDVSNFNAGIYIIKIIQGNKIQSSKLIIAR